MKPRTLVVGILIAIALLVAVILFAKPGNETAPDTEAALSPPQVDLSEVEPRVATLIDDQRRMVNDDPRNPVLWGTLGAALHAHNFFAAAATCYAHAQSLDAEDSRWTYLQALCLELTGGDIESLINLYQRTTELRPDYTPAYVNFGAALSRAGQDDTAEQALRTALEQERDWALTHRLLGQIYVRQRRYEEALSHLERANELTPGDRSTLAALAQALQATGETDRARSFADQSALASDVITLPDLMQQFVNSLGVSAQKCDERARSLMAAGDFRGAVDNLTIVLETRPDDAKVHSRLGEAYARLQQDGHAISHWQRAIEIDPKQPAVYRNLAFAHSRANQPLESVRFLATGFPHSGDDETYLMELISAYMAVGAAVEAVSTLEGYIIRNPHSRNARLRLSDLYVRMQRLDEAVAQLLAIVEMNAGDADAHFGLGVVYEQQNDRARAIAAYQEAARIDPAHRASLRLAELGGGT